MQNRDTSGRRRREPDHAAPLPTAAGASSAGWRDSGWQWLRGLAHTWFPRAGRGGWWLWPGHALVGLCGIAVFAVVRGDVAYFAVACWGTLGAVVGAALAHGPRRGPWWWMAAAHATFVCGAFVQSRLDASGISATRLTSSDLLYVVATALLATALLSFIRDRGAGPISKTGLLDGAVVLVSTGLVGWWVLVMPALAETAPFPAPGRFRVLYPLADLGLLALVAWLASAPETRSPALKLLVLGLVAWTLADVLYHAVSQGLEEPAKPMFLLWLSGYVAWGSAALHPSRRCLQAMRDPARADGTAGRLSLVALVMLAAPISLLAPAHPDAATATIAVFVVAGVASLLLWLRMSLLQSRMARQRESLLMAAQTDALTGLPNRRRLLPEAQRLLQAGDRVALLVIDVDRFGAINEAYGHRIGDGVLCELAARWRALLRNEDLLAHMGSDEFCVLMPSLHDEADADACACRLHDLLHEPLEIDGARVRTSASIGISIGPDDGTDPGMLVRQATIAMRRARLQQRGVQRFRVDLGADDVHMLLLVNDLRDGLAEGQLALHYQPKVRLHDMRVIGVEALLRWRHPTRGLVRPDEYIPLVERTELMADITRHVIATAVRQCAAWEREGLSLNIAVNLSTCSLLDPGLLAGVRAELGREKLHPERLELEITESAAMSDPRQTLRMLRALRASGVQLSVDDYGAGHSSLSYLQKLPVDELKLDKAFVTDLLQHDVSAVIVGSTIDLARRLGLRLVAEGVEDVRTAETLGRMHCFAAQGYWFSPPVEAAALPGVIAEIERRPRLVA